MANTLPRTPSSKKSFFILLTLLMAAPVPALALAEHEAFALSLAGSSLWGAASSFFIAGLLLSLTPCVLPMAPILWGIVAGPTGTSQSRARGIALSLAFGFGLALAYAAAGAGAALAGASLAPIMQSPAAIAIFSTALALLGLASLGVFSLSMPSFAENAAAKLTARLPKGKLGTAFAMGAASALIAGPCVAPPLAGALTYIGQTRDATLGGLALFSLAWGMSAPMVAFGAGLGALLPKTGRWSSAIQKVFGVALIALAAYFAYPLASRALSPTPTGSGAPAADARKAGSTITERDFKPIKNLAQLDAAIAASDKPVLLDIHAAWCVACEEIHQKTFPNPEVQAFLSNHMLLALDATDMDEDTQAMMKRYSVFGPPALFVFSQGSPAGALPRSSLLGFAEPAKFLSSLHAKSR